MTGAGELRVKESDRITRAGRPGCARSAPTPTNCPTAFTSAARGRLTGGMVHAHDDHRLAMAFAVAALAADGPVTIEGADAAAVSYPVFFDDLERLRA